MDVVYVCRPGRNEELRYSLRSLVNLPHDRVFVAGSWPKWLTGVEVVPVRAERTKYASTTANLLAACRAGVAERFAYFNDDFFVMEPVETLPVLHRGPLEQVAWRHTTLSYGRSMADLARWLRLRGYDEPLCYELHVPMELERDRLVEVLALPVPRPARDAHKRSLYGNWWRIGGERADDCKVFGSSVVRERPFLSTSDSSFTSAEVGRLIRARFPEPSPYER